MGCASSSQAPRAQSPQKQDRNDHGVAETREAPAKGGSPSAKDAKNVNEVKPVAPAEPAAPHDASKVDAAPAANAAGSGPELHLARVSVSCHGPWILLRAAGIEHQLVDVDLMTGAQMQPDFLKINPAHCVPTLRDGDFCLWESNAIMRYICSANESAKKFYPAAPEDLARTECALDWKHTVLYKHIASVAYPVLGFMQVSDAEQDASKAALVGEDGGALNMLADHFLKGRDYIGGDEPNIADFAIVPALMLLRVREDITMPEPLFGYVRRFSEKMTYDDVLSGLGAFGFEALVQMAQDKKNGGKESGENPAPEAEDKPAADEPVAKADDADELAAKEAAKAEAEADQEAKAKEEAKAEAATTETA
ncbi:Glutathione S-transferase 1 [Diplonema papillatum]|nr:Glutathione S-transferase 1 [Diplonema papillatum]